MTKEQIDALENFIAAKILLAAGSNISSIQAVPRDSVVKHLDDRREELARAFAR